jgi:hypothetical protein
MQSAESMGTCGSGGATCAPCATGQACSGGKCVCNATSCPNGCCDTTGKCQTSANPTCGTGGVACASCGSGTTCSSGTCVCNASSCGSGCCNGGSCLAYASESNALCGGGGATCAPCGSGQTCSTANGTCGSTSTGPCTWTGGPSSTNGEITCYWFGQGTAKGGGCGSFKTYCGYCGTESGSNNGGTCPTGITDGVQNTGTSYFAAFPVGSFGQGTYCGMCVDVTWMGKTITATIVDECATCPTSSHIDLSLSAAAALGLGQGTTTGDATSGVTWKAVDCPVTGNIVGVFNGSSQQIYFQNVTFPVAKAVAGGHTATRAFGYWDFGTAVGGMSVTLTDSVGHVITGTIPSSSGGSVGAQFPMTCQ